MLNRTIQAVYPEILFIWNRFMKRTLFFALAVLVLIGCKGGGKTDSAADTDGAVALDKDSSYAFGMYLGEDLKQTGLGFNYAEFARGFKDVLEGKETRLSSEGALEKIEAAFSRLSEKQNEANRLEAEENRQRETEFLAANAQKTGVQITGSGLQYEVISGGTGVKPQGSDTVEVNYEGTLSDGAVFDSSYARGEPIEFPLNQVIPGWSEGIQLMNVGSKYRFYIPSALAYGDDGIPGVIPPSSPLIFEVELISIVK
jgi:FKBP-type peptidyl-prolyl cis-trans isomerase FkpA